MAEPDLLRRFQGSRFLLIPGYFGNFGGAERQSVILGRKLVEDYGCHVDYLAWAGDGEVAAEIRSMGCVPWSFPLPAPTDRWRFYWALMRLSRLIRSEIRPDYLLPFVGFHCKVIGSIWRYTGAKFCWWNQRDEGRLIHGTRTERRLVRNLPAVVSNSIEGRDFLIEKFQLPPDRVRLINNGVPIPNPMEHNALEWRQRLALGPGDFLIAMVANLSNFKDHRTLLQAYRKVRETELGQRCNLVLAGQHNDTTQQLKALCYDFGMCDSVHLPGAIKHPGNLYASADLVVHSSIKEGCPNAVLEAMSHRCAVVGTDIPGMRQALGETNACETFAQAGNAEDLSRIMLNMLRSPDSREQAGANNRQRIEKVFGVDRMVKEVLETVLEGRIS